jgi:hypothetical protein
MNAIVYPAGWPTPAAFALDSNGNPVGLQTPNAGLYNISLFPSGDTSGAKDTAAFSATNGAYTGGPEITLKSVLGSAPWIQSKMEIGLTNVANNAACVFHGYFGLEVRGGCALFALGQTNT